MISALKPPARSASLWSFAVVATAVELPLLPDETAAIAAADEDPALDIFGVEFAAEDWVADVALA
jgi:hypothetical protein